VIGGDGREKRELDDFLRIDVGGLGFLTWRDRNGWMNVSLVGVGFGV
jgi:hypothetical protein